MAQDEVAVLAYNVGMRKPLLALSLLVLAGAVRAQEIPEAYEAAQAGLRDFPVKAPGQVDMTFSDEMLAYLKSLPAYDVGKHGHPGSALTIIFIGDKSQIKHALHNAHWTGVPRSTPLAFVEGLGQLVTARQITKFPSFHNYTVEGQKQKENWSQVVYALTARHHFRLWKLSQPDPYRRQVWWGSASYDTGLRWKGIIPVTHNTSPDIDAERDYIAKTLSHEPTVMRIGLVTLPQIPREGVNDQKDHYFTDGRALVVELGRPIPPDAADPTPEELDESVSSSQSQ